MFGVLSAPGLSSAQVIGQTSSNFYFGGSGQGQSFTATVTGTITEIRIRPANSTPDTLRFYDGEGSGVNNGPGVPIYSQPVTSVAAANNSAPLQSYVLTTPLPIQSGNTYTFIFENTLPWHLRNGGNVYTAGDYILFYDSPYGDGRDIAFQVVQAVTVAAIPTLSEWAMILFGTILVGGAAVYIQRRQLSS